MTQSDLAPGAGGAVRDIGPLGALSIGIGGIVGGGFFATFGLAVVGARGSTFLSFLVGGLVALLTAYSYVGLTLRYPDPAGTASFVRRAFGRALIPASVNVLLIYSYVCVMAVYAHAFGAYGASYFPVHERPFLAHVFASAAIVALGAINYAGAALMAKFEGVFNLGKLGALGLFIAAGFLMGAPDWSRLGPDNWESAPRIVSSGIIAFLSYEGFELISNASPRIVNPARTLPIAYYGSVIAAIFIYVLAIVVAIGHMPFADMAEAQNFAVSATAERFMGSFGFALMTAGAMLASASAINADFFGASQLPLFLARNGDAAPIFAWSASGRPIASMVFIGGVALLAVNVVELAALSAATSAGFLLVFAAVNLAHARLAHETGGRKWVSWLGAAVCLIALGVTFYDFIVTPAAHLSAVGMVAIVLIAIACEQTYRIFWRRQPGAWAGAAVTTGAMAALALVTVRSLAPLPQPSVPEPAPAPVAAPITAPLPEPTAPKVEPVAAQGAPPAEAPAIAAGPAKTHGKHAAPAVERRKHGKPKG